MKHKRNRGLALLLTLAMLVSLCAGLAAPAAAAGTVDFDLSVVDAEDPHHIYVDAGSTFLVTMTVHFPADAQSFVLKWMQDEILYDSGFFYTTRTRGTGNRIDVSFVQFLGRPMVKLSTMGVTLTAPDTAVASFYLQPRAGLADGTTTVLRNGSVMASDANDQRYTVTTQDLTVTIGPKPLPTSTVTYSTGGGAMSPTAFPEIDAEYVDHEGETPYYAQTVLTGATLTLPAAPTLERHRFDGWSDGTNTYAAGETVTVDADLAFTALWTAWPRITLNANGGELEGESEVYVQPGTGLDLPALTRENYDFLGWSDGEKTYTDTYIAGTENAALTARWQAWPTLTLAPAGGSVSGETSFTRRPGTKITLPTPARDGYDFLGWFEGDTRCAESYTLGSASVTLNARWAQRRTLTLDANGGSVSGPSSFTGAAGTAVDLPTPFKINASFGGWSDGTDSYGGSIVMPDRDLTLTAQWTDFPTLMLDPGEGTVDGARAFTQEAGTSVTLPEAVRAGYTFLGWGPERRTGEYTMGERSETLTAQWLKHPTVTLDPDGGDLGETPAATTDLPGTQLDLPALSRTGYLFGGWSDGSRTYTDSYTLGDDDATLTAQWTECEHKNAEFAQTGATEWAHVEGGKTHTRTVYFAATCPDCGAELTRSETETAACDYGSGWTITAAGHSHACSVCGFVADEAEHSYSGDTCTVCGFKNPALSMPVEEEVELEPEVSVDGTTATITALSSEALAKAADVGNPSDPIVLDLSGEADRVDSVKLSADLAREIAGLETADGVEFTLTDGRAAFNTGALNAILAAGSGEIEIALRPGTFDELSETQRKAFGTSDVGTVFFVTATIGGKAVTSLNGGIVTITVPGTVDPDESFDVYHVSDAGKLARTVNFLQKSELTVLTDRLSDFVLVKGALTFPDPPKPPQPTESPEPTDPPQPTESPEPTEPPQPTESPEIVFEDVEEGSYYAEAVDWAVKAGVTNGVDDTHFAPAQGCTRAQFVTFLWRAAGKPEPTVENRFTDVNETAHAPYYKAILWAVEKGITNGTNAEGTLFSPNAVVTRGQAVTFMNRYDGGAGDGSSSFADVPAGQYYSAAVDWAVARGITKGANADGTQFIPAAPCTRAQMVTFLFRMFMPQT